MISARHAALSTASPCSGPDQGRRNLGRVLDEIATDISNGDQFSEAIAHHPQWFDEFYVSMVRAGECSGSLGDVLERLADATESAVAPPPADPQRHGLPRRGRVPDRL